MRILMCHNFYANEGGENTVFRQEIEILKGYGHDVREYTRSSTEIANMRTLSRLVTLREGFYSSKTKNALTDIVREFRPQVAIVQNVFPLLSPAVYTVLHTHGIPIVQLVFNYRFLCINAQLYIDRAVCERCVRGVMHHAVIHRCLHGSYAQSLWYAAIIGWHRSNRTFQRSIQRFVVPHTFVGEKLVEGGLAADRIRINPNPYRMPDPAWDEAIEPYIIYIGRVIPEKGLLTLVRALKRVPGPLALSIVGNGEGLSEINDYLANNSDLAHRVRMHGQLWGDANHNLLAGAQAIVLPAEWHDVSPLLLYNALALGKPAIASNLGSQPEIITDGVDGLIFQAGNVDDLAAKITLLAKSRALRQQMGHAGRLKAEQTFTIEAHYQRLHAILQEVAL